MLEAEALPGTAALIHWFETSTKNRSFLEGAAAINLAAEGQVPGAFANFARPLENRSLRSQRAVSRNSNAAVRITAIRAIKVKLAL